MDEQNKRKERMERMKGKKEWIQNRQTNRHPYKV